MISKCSNILNLKEGLSNANTSPAAIISQFILNLNKKYSFRNTPYLNPWAYSKFKFLERV